MEDLIMKLPNYKLCTLHLHPVKDADIIQWLDCQRLADSKTNAIRKLIRKQIRAESDLLCMAREAFYSGKTHGVKK